MGPEYRSVRVWCALARCAFVSDFKDGSPSHFPLSPTPQRLPRPLRPLIPSVPTRRPPTQPPPSFNVRCALACHAFVLDFKEWSPSAYSPWGPQGPQFCQCPSEAPLYPFNVGPECPIVIVWSMCFGTSCICAGLLRWMQGSRGYQAPAALQSPKTLTLLVLIAPALPLDVDPKCHSVIVRCALACRAFVPDFKDGYPSHFPLSPTPPRAPEAFKPSEPPRLPTPLRPPGTYVSYDPHLAPLTWALSVAVW